MLIILLFRDHRRVITATSTHLVKMIYSTFASIYVDFTNEADVEDDNKQLLKKHSRPFEHVTDVSSILAVININMIISIMSTITLTRRMPSNQKADLSTINSDSSLQFPHSGLKEFVRISWKNFNLALAAVNRQTDLFERVCKNQLEECRSSTSSK